MGEGLERLLGEYESGRMSRRELLAALALSTAAAVHCRLPIDD